MATASKATITRSGDVLVVITPHTAEFPEQARKLHGRWNGHAWVFAANQLEEVEALCLRCFDAVEVEHAPAFALAEQELDEAEPTGVEEITIPGLTEQDEEEEQTAVTQVKGGRRGSGSDSGSDSESAPVRVVMREVDPQEQERADLEEQERVNIEAEIDRLSKRLRFLLDRLAELDEPDE